MKSLIYVLFLTSSSVPTLGVLYQPPTNSYSSKNDTEDFWTECWMSQTNFHDVSTITNSMGACIKHRLYLGLTNSVEQQCVDIGDGVTFIATGEEGLTPRDIFPLGAEPSSFRGVADAYSSFLSRRGIRWDLSHLYPGLVMKIGPTLGGDGILEFTMERRLDYFDRAKLGPGQQMIRRAILPHLLGFRMNIMTILPLAFGVLVYVAKNAFIFSKLTLIISTLLALKSLFVLKHLRPPGGGGFGNELNDPVAAGSDPVSLLGGPRPQPHNLHPGLILQMFEGALPPFRGVNDKPDEHKLSGYRNFAWEKTN